MEARNVITENALRLKLVSYNLCNLGRGEFVDDEAYNEKLHLLANVLIGIDADLVVVNEIREEKALKDLADVCGIYPNYILGDSRSDARELHTGILTKLSVLATGEWVEYSGVVPGHPGAVEKLLFSRPVPWVKVRLPNSAVLFVAGVHLKSRRAETEAVPGTWPERQREVLGQSLAAATRALEAGGLRSLLDEEMVRGTADYYALLGDFNDLTDSSTVKLVCGLRAGDCEAKGEADCRLFPAASKMPAGVYSYAGTEGPEMIDQILVSAGLYRCLTRAGAESSLLEQGQPFSGSDHAPVWAEFALTGQK